MKTTDGAKLFQDRFGKL